MIRLHGGDGVDNVQPVRDLAEPSILAVEMRRVLVHDKKLAAGRVGTLRARHRQHAARMLERIVHAVCLEFPLDAVAGVAVPLAERTAALEHEAGNDAVEDQAVVKAFFDERNKIVDGIGCDIGIQLGGDHAAVFHGDRYYRISHLHIPFLDRSVHLAGRVPRGRGLALIVQLLPLAQTKPELDVGIFKIHRQRDEREALLLDTPVELHNLALMHEKPPGTHRVTVENVAFFIGADVHPPHEQFTVFDRAVRFLERDIALPDALDLRAEQLDARLEFFEHKVVMIRFFIIRDLLDAAGLWRHIKTTFHRARKQLHRRGPRTA